MARVPPRDLARCVARTGEGRWPCWCGHGREVRHPLRSARGGALLRLDRWAGEGRRRRIVVAEVHSTRTAEYLVENQSRESGGAHQERRDETSRPRGDRNSEGEWTLGCRVRRAADGGGPDRPAGGARSQRE